MMTSSGSHAPSSNLAGQLATYTRRGHQVSVYLASAQNVDCDGRYVVVCERHGSMLGSSNKRRAIADMRCSREWCEACELEASGQPSE